MATVLLIDGFEIIIYTNDHRPMHVHVWHGEMEVEIYLVDFSIKDLNRQATPKFVRESVALVCANRNHLMREWKRIWKKRQGEA